MSIFDISVIHPGAGETIQPFKLVSREGLNMILSEMVTNFTDFAPPDSVLVALPGIGIAEGSRLIGTVLRPGTIDPLPAGLSEEGARIADPTYGVNPACND